MAKRGWSNNSTQRSAPHAAADAGRWAPMAPTRGCRRGVDRRWPGPLFILVAASPMPGCGLIAYAEPDSGPVARVRLVNDSNGVASGIRQYDDNNCETGEREVARFGTGSVIDNHKSIGIPDDPDIPKGQKTEIRVRGGQPFYGVYWTGSTLPSECRVAFEFVPEAGRDYQVTFHWNVYQSWCSATLRDLAQAAATPPTSIEAAPGHCEGPLARTYLY